MKYDVIEYVPVFENGIGDLLVGELDPLIEKPVPALTFLSKQSKLDSFSCPAVVDYLKNVYFITSPFDFSIRRLRNGNFEIFNPKDPNINLSQFLKVGVPETQKLYGLPMFTMYFQFTFINKDNNVIMEVIDPPLFHNGLTNITGEFNISKWIRPTNFCCFMDPNIEQLNIERGDPLYAVRFRSETNNFKLVEVLDKERSEAILAEQRKAVSIKKYVPGLKLYQMYDLFKKRMTTLWRT